MFDELREQASSSSFAEEAPRVERAPYRERRFLGMTAFQRFFITLMLLFITCLLGTFFLIVTQKIAPGFLVY